MNNIKRTLAVGDIHGANKALIQVLERANVTDDDLVIFLGDYVDGWEESPEVIDTILKIKNKILIKGNHDQWFIECLLYTDFQLKYSHTAWLNQGGRATYDAYNKNSKYKDQNHIEFFKNLQNYYIDDKNRLFVHGGFESNLGVIFEDEAELYWNKSLWKECINYHILNNLMHKDKSLYKMPSRTSLYSEIYIGHSNCQKVDDMKPVTIGNVTNLDTGAGWSGKLTIMDINTKEYWQSDIVKELYPNSKGR